MLTLDATVDELQEKITKKNRSRSIKLDDNQKHVVNDLRALNKSTVSGREYLATLASSSGRSTIHGRGSAAVPLGCARKDVEAGSSHGAGLRLMTHDFMKDGNLSLLSDSGYGNDSTLKSIIASVATDPKNWECVVCDGSHDYRIMDRLRQLNTPAGPTIDEMSKFIGNDDGGKYAWLPGTRATNVTLSDNNAYDLMKILAELDKRLSVLAGQNNDGIRDIRDVHGLESIKNILLIVDVGSGFASCQNGNILRKIAGGSSIKARVFTVFTGQPKSERTYKYQVWYSINDWIPNTVFNGYIDPSTLSKNGYCKPESDAYKIMAHVSRTYRTSLLTSGGDVKAFMTPTLDPDVVSKAIQPWCWQPSSMVNE